MHLRLIKGAIFLQTLPKCSFIPFANIYSFHHFVLPLS